jgi:hypothetical protein
MRYFAGQLLLSAGDLNTFLGCRHATALAKRVIGGELIETGPSDPTLELVQRRGLQHEARFLASLRADGRAVTEIDSHLDLRRRIENTTRAMREGADVIFQAALARGRWHGFADFLLRVDNPLEQRSNGNLARA